MSNPLPFYFELNGYKYLRYQDDDTCLKVDLRNQFIKQAISLSTFEETFRSLTDWERAKWLKWKLPNSIYEKWSK
jgi:hypothetical protein